MALITIKTTLLMIFWTLIVYKMVVNVCTCNDGSNTKAIEEILQMNEIHQQGFRKVNQGKARAGLFNLTEESADESFHGLSLLSAQTIFAQFCTTLTTACAEPHRFGNRSNGGYELCMSAPFTLQPQSCIVYSFGIGKLWDFDDTLQTFGCEVHSFDPSIGLEDHIRAERHRFWNMGLWNMDMVNGKGWQLHTLNTIIAKLGHEGKVIDVVKVDIEGGEWPFLKQILRTDALKHIKQLIFEIHAPVFKSRKMTVGDLASIYNDLTELRDKWNFHLYMEHHRSNCCGRFNVLTPAEMTGNHKPLCCYELHFVNNNYRIIPYRHTVRE